ncbi:hypothetical protein XELAEV_18038858mg [Xenopus laevis]|uniref:Uncharacterized protein n=1 Tax=Xenopus laevis TaxID=8355 RepID=A0A974C6F7_XENLA|nr:hypothetical protein XELAEV_18038858mg [Xenopus laevis]
MVLWWAPGLRFFGGPLVTQSNTACAHAQRPRNLHKNGPEWSLLLRPALHNTSPVCHGPGVKRDNPVRCHPLLTHDNILSLF